MRRSVHTLTFSEAVDTSDTVGGPQFVDAETLGQLTTIPEDLLGGLRAKVLGQAGDDLDVGGAEFFHVHNVDDPASDVNNVDKCPLCGGTGQRRIRRPGTPRRASVLVDCICAATPKDTK